MLIRYFLAQAKWLEVKEVNAWEIAPFKARAG